MIRQGEVRWYSFKPPDKRRPVVVLTRDSIIPWLNEVTIAPVTSVVRGIPSEVSLDRADGMPAPCAVNCDHLQTVPQDRLGKVLTTLSPARMAALRAAVIFALALEEE
jgi:mRNA interferase MazF